MEITEFMKITVWHKHFQLLKNTTTSFLKKNREKEIEENEANALMILHSTEKTMIAVWN